jgi:hypothetical protein
MSSFNGEILLSGHTYPTLNAAWLAARAAAQPYSGSSKGNQTIRLAAGSFKATATMFEPINGTCISVIGSAATGQQVALGSPAGLSSTEIVVNSSASIGGDLFSLQNSSDAQAQGCDFENLTIVGHGASGLTGSAFNFQWFRGLTLENITINDTGATAIILGESSGTHQSNFYMRNLIVSYDPGDGVGYTPASRPAYGVQLLKTAIDSNVDTLFCRNPLTACVGTAAQTTFYRAVHGFGFPYSCTSPPCDNHASSAGAANASWASDYVIYDTGGANNFSDSYLDSPAIAGFYIGNNGDTITGGRVDWPDTVSFPHANLASVASSVTAGLIIQGINCIGMSSTAGAPSSPAGSSGVWISFFATAGLSPSYSPIANLGGCGEYYQARVSARQTAFDIAGNNSSNTNFGTTGEVPKVFGTPLSTAGTEGIYEAENFAGGEGDLYYGGYSASPSSFAIRPDGTGHFAGGMQTGTVSVTSSATLTTSDHNVLASASSGALTLTLPTCSTAMADGLVPLGMEMVVYKTDVGANTVTLSASGGETINYAGVTAGTLVIATPGSRTLVCGPDSNWYAR